MDNVKIAMVALGGYGNFYLARLFSPEAQEIAGPFEFVAGIDPDPRGCRYLEVFEATGVPIYPDLDAFYARDTADLVIIAAPIHLHLPFTRTALAHGANVLCEKPVAATIQEARQMAEADAAAERFVAIGYQWSYAATMQALKADIIAGVFGKPVRFRTKVLWPRTQSYYHRNTWAARKKTSGGSWVLDSPVNNATAHYLHNCFYVLGATRETSARPVDVQAELYRANDIENYDTAALRCHTDDDVEVLFYTSHPVDQNIGPTLIYEFEDAVVHYGVTGGTEHRGDTVVATFKDGRVKDYGNPFADDATKLWDAMDAVRTGAPLACGVDAAMSHTLAVNGAQESMADIVDFPEDVILLQEQDEDVLVYVDGLVGALERCYDAGVLPSELGTLPWAKAGEVVDLRGYLRFPSS
ncbi:MAG: Gfo/Idh/MocA family oxidoreductase [Anaerolineae bacterium]|nr:Gfo/Idh/MocA family oxidoreductase [Anaerolineae bacterium]